MASALGSMQATPALLRAVDALPPADEDPDDRPGGHDEEEGPVELDAGREPSDERRRRVERDDEQGRADGDRHREVEEEDERRDDGEAATHPEEAGERADEGRDDGDDEQTPDVDADGGEGDQRRRAAGVVVALGPGSPEHDGRDDEEQQRERPGLHPRRDVGRGEHPDGRPDEPAEPEHRPLREVGLAATTVGDRPGDGTDPDDDERAGRRGVGLHGEPVEQHRNDEDRAAPAERAHDDADREAGENGEREGHPFSQPLSAPASRSSRYSFAASPPAYPVSEPDEATTR